MTALRQLDAAGNTLGGGGSAKHSFNSFATQSFTFGAPISTTYQGLNTTKIDFDSVLVGSSKVRISTYIFMQAGRLTIGRDTLNVKQGTVKFNVELSSWSWCGDAGVVCRAADGTGASVELDIEMKGNGGANPQRSSTPYTSSYSSGSYSSSGASSSVLTYNLGGGQVLKMLATFSMDDGSTWTTMPSGYPQLDGSKFTLKFPRWTTNAVLYDPVVGYAIDGTSPSSPTPSATPSPTSALQKVITQVFTATLPVAAADYGSTAQGIKIMNVYNLAFGNMYGLTELQTPGCASSCVRVFYTGCSVSTVATTRRTTVSITATATASPEKTTAMDTASTNVAAMDASTIGSHLAAFVDTAKQSLAVSTGDGAYTSLDVGSVTGAGPATATRSGGSASRTSAASAVALIIAAVVSLCQ